MSDIPTAETELSADCVTNSEVRTRPPHAPFFLDVPGAGNCLAVECVASCIMTLQFDDAGAEPSVLLAAPAIAGTGHGLAVYSTMSATECRERAATLLKLADAADAGRGKQ